ncbi:Lipid A biosynthesis lauroyltransferase [Sinobacterium norvegicum]|uniref:Lipid A biosynthesis lauroyltransferase n=1 Tax=Sinobacterium norvegicum TaxID=1641715 RepID=A0ABM9AIF6_9GAMM|nr:lysophospholipid acyltransferase family protein [Sinobacterium norvegicum]CAH0993011.1 Lipid A biosynthesis lauroyltransferase [Sinobacterium norvegicum]
MSESQAENNSFKAKLVILVFNLVGILPLFLLRAIGKAAGYLIFRQQGRSYQVTMRNLELCFPEMPEPERLDMTRRSLIETGMLGAEVMQVWARPWAKTRNKIVKVNGLEKFTDPVNSDKATILLAPHLGNWEVLGLYMAEFGQMMCLYQPPKQAIFEGIIKQSREKSGTVAVPTNKKGVMALMKALKKGGTTGILPDQQPELSGGCFAPFFGVDALTITLISSLIQRNDCRVVMGYAKRVAEGYEVNFTDPDPEIYSDDQLTSVTAMNRSVEACVMDCPEQYQWEYKRFNKQPEGQPRFYKKM